MDVISLLHPYLTVHYSNQSVSAIVPDLNIFVWSIKIFDLISRSTLIEYFSITCSIFVYPDGYQCSTILVRYQTRASVIVIVIGECTVLLLMNHDIRVCAVLFLFDHIV